MADRIVVMRDGVVEQAGLPLELYDRPASQFVAGFIGSPSMNFLSGLVLADGGLRFVTDDGVSLPLKSAPQGLEGKRCVYGIRPEHLALVGSGLEAVVTVSEPTGSETQVFARLGASKIVGVFRERVTTRPGETLHIQPNLDAVHLFDADSGLRLN